jgi:photosystem II stability/assembly factor-like uncharacterized protein
VTRAASFSPIVTVAGAVATTHFAAPTEGWAIVGGRELISATDGGGNTWSILSRTLLGGERLRLTGGIEILESKTDSNSDPNLPIG